MRILQLTGLPLHLVPGCLLLLCVACSDYQTGYQEGYKNTEARNWLVLGRQAYWDGYSEGQMQAFHDDWYQENEKEIDAVPSCPAVVMKTNPVVFIDDRRYVRLK